MRARTWTIAIALVGLVVCVALFSPQLQPQRRAIAGMIGHVLRGGDHPLVVMESANRAAGARYNLEVIARATEYIATIGSNTQVFREIVGVASTADHECPLLEEALDLAVRKQSETAKIVALAKAACRVTNAEQESAWRRSLAWLERSADFDSVESALEQLRDR